MRYTIGRAAAALLFCTNAWAATCTWTGNGANSNWSNADNWDTCQGIRSIPLNTDTLIFPDGAARTTNVNDIAALKPTTIELGSQAYDISGNAITLSNSVVTNTPNGLSGPKFGLPITFSSGVTFDCQAGYFAYINGALAIGTFGFAVDGVCNTSIKGPVSGDGGLFKFGSGTLYMQSAVNSYTGVTTINGGTIYVGNDAALGATGPGNGTKVKATTSLTLYLGVDLAESIELNGGELASYIGTNRVLSGVTLTADSSVSAAAGATLRISGPLAGNGYSLIKTGQGTVVIEDANAVGYLAVGGGVAEVYGTIDGGLVSGGSLAGKGPMTNTLVLNTGGRFSPGSGGGKNPGRFDGVRFNWQNGAVCEFQLGDRADQLALSISLAKVGSGTYAFDFRDGSTPPRIGVAYPLISYTVLPNFQASDFSFSYSGTGAGSAMAGTFALTADALTFTPSSVTSDLIFRDGLDD